MTAVLLGGSGCEKEKEEKGLPSVCVWRPKEGVWIFIVCLSLLLKVRG